MLQLETPRLVLRDWIDADLPLIETLASDPDVTRYQTWLRLGDAEGAARHWLSEAMFHNQQEPRFAYSTAVVSKKTGLPIGWLGWGDAGDPRYGDTSFGYALLRSEWGNGYMPEAVMAMLAFVFETTDRSLIYATCATSNGRSSSVLEKAGLTLVHRWMQRDDETDAEEEHLFFRIDRTDWVRRATGVDAE